MNPYNITVSGNFIKVSGVLDGKGGAELAGAIKPGNMTVVDFGELEEIRFAALREILNGRKAGLDFVIVNASQEVADRFEDSGVSFYVSVCRKPAPLDLGKYEEFGAGFLSKAYNSEDGDSMIKVYGKMVAPDVVVREKIAARAVMLFGIPTPLVGKLYNEGEYNALDFERIQGKRSFSRIMADEPERTEELSVRFARMCKELHSKECDTTIFPDRKIFYRKAVRDCAQLGEEEKAKAFAFIDSIPEATTCLHGDMQISNVITTGKEDLWIDLSDFSYGYPMLDMGMWYFLAKLNSEQYVFDIFHIHKDQMSQVWEYFRDEYFDVHDDKLRADIDEQIRKYAALHMIFLGTNYMFVPGMLDNIREILF